MLPSLLVYGLTGAVLFFLGWHVNKREQQSLLKGGAKLPFYSWEIMLSLLIFSIIAGARYHTGYDHAMYLDQYLHLQKTGDFSRQNFEYGFEWISRFFAWCNIHYFFYFAFWALLQIGFLYFGLRHHKHLLCWVGLGIMCGSFFLGWMNSVRQSVVVCLFVALIPLINDRKFLPYLLIVIVAAFIHKSALLLLPVFLLTFIDVKEIITNRKVLMGVFACFVILGVIVGAIPWDKFLGNYQWILDLIGYSNYGNTNDPNVVGQFKGLGSWGISRVPMLLGCISIIWFYPELKSHFSNDKLLSYFFVLAYIGMCLYYLLINTTHYILRPIDYFTIFYLIMGAYMMVYLLRTRKTWVAIFLALVLYTHFIGDVYKGVYRPSRTTVPFIYHTFLIPSI